jgi:uncharacterized protein (DUF1778 family)
VNTIRNRIINFRVSEEEFRRLKAAATLHNARCLSDFARTAVLRVAGTLEQAPPMESPESTLQSMDKRLTILESNMARLVEVLTNR